MWLLLTLPTLRRSSIHLALMRRSPPCCNSETALLLTNLLLDLPMLIQRFHHGNQLKEEIAPAAHGKVSSVMRRRVM
ncbi:hypothetical protein ACFX2H_040074 [Malus domestica]